MIRRALVVMTVLACVPILLPGQSRTAGPSLEGVWRAQEMAWVGGASPRTAKSPQPYFRIYTARHFALVGLLTDQARRVLEPLKTPGKPTDAEKIAAFEHWQPFHGQAGTYEIKGQQIVHRWDVGRMASDTRRVQTHDFKFEGANTLWMFNREASPELHIRYTRLE